LQTAKNRVFSSTVLTVGTVRFAIRPDSRDGSPASIAFWTATAWRALCVDVPAFAATWPTVERACLVFVSLETVATFSCPRFFVWPRPGPASRLRLAVFLASFSFAISGQMAADACGHVSHGRHRLRVALALHAGDRKRTAVPPVRPI
jgi:hypothetical protein